MTHNAPLSEGPDVRAQSAPNVRPIRTPVDHPGRASWRRWPLSMAMATLGVLVVATLPAHELKQPHDHPPERGGTLRFIQERVTTLDPKELGDVYSATVAAQVHRGLLFYGTNLTPMPDLAESWTISRDGLEFIFRIRAGARFHNGRTVTADDFIYTFQRIFTPGGDPGLAGQFLSVIEGAEEYHAGRVSRIRGLTALSDRSLRIRLARPDASFLWALAMSQAAVVPREEVERLGNAGFAARPVGCGPFRIVSVAEDRIVLAASSDYYSRRAWVDSLIFLMPGDHNAERDVRGLLESEWDIAEIPGSHREKLSRSGKVRLISRRELSLSFVGLNTTIPPFDRPLVRQAVAHCVDREAILRVNPAGLVAATGILPPGMSCYSPEVKALPFDLDLAAEKLARAGFPGGRGLPSIRYVTTAGSTRSRAVDSLLIANFRKVGMPVEYVRVDWVELQQRIDDYSLPLFSLSWVADIPDPDSFMGSLFASWSADNYSRFADAEVDSLIRLGRVTVDPRKRQAIYGRLERLILENAPVVPLYTGTTAYGVRRADHGLELTPLGISCVDLANVWIESPPHEQASTR
jgi:oligopeptide transport system substrate-binding protein